MDVHVMSVWKQGITGKGVVVTILDDGKALLKNRNQTTSTSSDNDQ
jgi:uncharacterized protein YlxW (UPF0749 family)